MKIRARLIDWVEDGAFGEVLGLRLLPSIEERIIDRYEPAGEIPYTRNRVLFDLNRECFRGSNQCA